MIAAAIVAAVVVLVVTLVTILIIGFQFGLWGAIGIIAGLGVGWARRGGSTSRSGS